MRIKVFESEVTDIALKIAEKKSNQLYRYDYSFLIFNKNYEIIEIELHYSDCIGSWKFTVKIDEIKKFK